MDTIEFNLEKYNSGKYSLVTRDGREARIVCTDVAGSFPILALVRLVDGTEAPFAYTESGEIDDGDDDLDLLLIKNSVN